MDFRTRRIRKRPPFHPTRQLKRGWIWALEHFESFGPKRHHYMIGGVLVVIASLIVFRVMSAAYTWVRGFDPQSLVLAAGSDLRQDENGYTNIVLLGDGGHVRDGADLIDTIMVASIDYQKNAVTLLSIPRDYYTRNIGIDDGRINELYRNNKLVMPNGQSFELFKEAAGELAGLKIHYYFRADFSAFVELVDALEGVDIDVPKTIDDPYYPKETDDGYATFKIEAGLQHLDGETALKYVRSRKTTSDFDRASRQQLVLAALREKAMNLEILAKPKVLKNMFGAIQKNIDTDMTVREVISLAAFAKDFDRSHLIAKVLHDDPGQDGGFLYTPERQYYNGQFVLIPFGDSLEIMHKYADLIFNKREAFYKPMEVEILNATKASGLAGKTAYQLNRFGFAVGNIENLLDAKGDRVFSAETVIRYYDWTADDKGQITPKNPVFLEALQEFIKGKLTPADPTLSHGAAATVILGDDYDVFLVD